MQDLGKTVLGLTESDVRRSDKGFVLQNLLYGIIRIDFYVSIAVLLIGLLLLINFIMTGSYAHSGHSVDKNTLLGFVSVYLNKLDSIIFFNVNYYVTNIDSISIELPIIVSSIIGLIAYTYFFSYIKNKGVQSYHEDKITSKWFIAILTLFSFFGFVLLILIMHLLLQKLYTELIILLAFVFLSQIFNWIQRYTIGVLFNYDSLLTLNKEIVKKESKRDYINNKTNQMQSLIFLSTFIWVINGVLLNFNLLTMIYIEALFILWYSRLILVKHIPNSITDITLIDGKKFTNVFINDDFSKDYFNIIGTDDQQHVIMKGSVRDIKPNFQIKSKLSILDLYLSNFMIKSFKGYHLRKRK